MALSDNKNRKLGNIYDPVNLFLKHHYEDRFKNEE